MIEGGHVYIPNSASWLKEYRNQFMSFPSNGPGHDDSVSFASASDSSAKVVSIGSRRKRP
jgi:phage terminase large subunit-like protein